MRTIIASLALAASPLVAGAQQRAITLPDTLGANFSLTDSVTRTGTPEDYDPLLGVWHFTFQQRRPDGSFSPPFTGHWTFLKRAGGRPIIEDHWRSDNPNQPFESGTRTYRAFNTARKLWEVQGTSTGNGGPWQPGTGWSDSTSRYLVQYLSGATVMRFRYLALEPNRFLWRADYSADAGVTWIRDWWTMEAKRIGK